MSINELFEPNYIGNRDTATHRVCGTCGELKPVSDFYKDGKDRDGNPKYRRDCRECYKKTRIQEAKKRMKK